MNDDISVLTLIKDLLVMISLDIWKSKKRTENTSKVFVFWPIPGAAGRFVGPPSTLPPPLVVLHVLRPSGWLVQSLGQLKAKRDRNKNQQQVWDEKIK